MDLSYVVSFPEGVSVSCKRDGDWAFYSPEGRLTHPRLFPPIRDMLPRLVYPGVSAEKLARCVQSTYRRNAVTHLFRQLQDLAAQGFLQISVEEADRRLATLVPIASSFVLTHDRIGDAPYVLSRFAHLRRFEGAMVVESPLSPARILLHDPRAIHAIGALATSVTAAQIGQRISDLSPAVCRQLLNLLGQASMLDEVTPSGISSEDAHPALRGWEFHDLLFHSRSRKGRCDGVVGNTYPLAGLRELPPVVRPVFPGAAIELYRPDLNTLKSHDPPLATVMEKRRSIREYGPEPMTARQLGEFLYRVARVREVFEREAITPQGRFQVDLSSRPYPTGGALFELEVYPVVQACRDLAPGLYHYDPQGHRLVRVAGITFEVECLLEEAGLAVGMDGEQLQVLLVLAARFERVMWKYSGVSYSLIMKDVGVLFQNMYLAATAMDLAPCALGAGNSDLFARAIGSDYYSETSVGEFTLGSSH